MALKDDVLLRIPAHRLAQLTNPDSNSATAYDSTWLTQACTDAAAMFATYVGAEYDSTRVDDVRIAVDGVMALLIDRAGSDNKRLEKWKTDAREYAMVRGRDRILFVTTSELTPSTEVQPGETVRSAFDADAWDGYRPNQP